MGESPMLLCYDIRDPRRLGRVYRRARRVGMPIQYSVFYLELTRSRLSTLLDEIASVIDEKEDDIRVYNIGGFTDIEQIGESILPEGMLLAGAFER